MKSYLEVVRDRYDGREKTLQPQDNIYSIINPIGFNGHKGIATTAYKICRFLIDNGVDITTLRILDLGCGSGSVTRLLAEFTGKPENIVGIDLSEHRIRLAQEFTQSIRYLRADITADWPLDEHFDLVTAFDVFMHLDSEEAIRKTLLNVRNHLNPQGVFVWFDTFAKDHFVCPADAEANGFNPAQMDHLAGQAGFKPAYEFTLYKNILGRFHSLYLYGHWPSILVKTLEKTAPGHPGNIVKIFRRE